MTSGNDVIQMLDEDSREALFISFCLILSWFAFVLSVLSGNVLIAVSVGLWFIGVVGVVLKLSTE